MSSSRFDPVPAADSDPGPVVALGKPGGYSVQAPAPVRPWRRLRLWCARNRDEVLDLAALVLDGVADWFSW